MANEIRIAYNGTATLYALIRNSAAAVWNGSAFVTFANADLASYAVALSSAAGDLYQGTFPATIPVGAVYSLFIYRQEGAAPAITDLLLRARSYRWDGALSSSTGSITLSAYALCDVDYYKRNSAIALSNTDDDDLIRQAINAATDLIERQTNRQFVARDYIEWNRVDEGIIQTQQWPIVTLDRVASGRTTALQLTYTSTTAIRALASVQNGSLRLVTWDANGTATTTSLTLASYPSHTLLAAAVTNVAGWTATVQKNGLSVELLPLAPSDALNRTLPLDMVDQDLHDYELDAELGRIALNATPAGWRNPVLLRYNGGYAAASLPAGLVQLCADLAAAIVQYSEINPVLTKESLGDYAVSMADNGGNMVALLGPDDQATLRRYARIAIA